MRGSLLPLALVLVACRVAAPGAPAGTPASVSGVVRAPDGVPIAYDVRGAGKTALVLVHCWACDRSFWRHQLDVFARDWRVISLDLPGHGASGAERERWSVEDLAGDVQAVVEALRLPRVILIGHSMGGPVSLEAARRLPRRVVGIACVDTLHDAERKPPPGMFERFFGQLEADFAKTVGGFLRGMIAPAAQPAVLDLVMAAALRAKRAPVLALMRSFASLDLPRMFAAAKVPVRCVNAAPRPPMGPPTAIATNRKYADFDAVIMDGVGHYPMLERPAEFNARLREALAQIEASAGR